MRVYLVRHGETAWNREFRLQGQSDIELNDIGIELARITADALQDIRFDRIYSSPLVRAVTTAKILRGDRPLDILTDDRLLEIAFGEREGMIIPRRDGDPANPIYQFEFDTENYIPAKGGETFNDVFKRTSDFWDNEIIPLENKCESVLIIGHGAMNRTILSRLMDIPLRDFWTIKLDNCAVSIIDVTDGVSKVEETGKKYYSRDDDRFKFAKKEAASIYG